MTYFAIVGIIAHVVIVIGVIGYAALSVLAAGMRS